MSFSHLRNEPSVVYAVTRLRDAGFKDHQIAGILGSAYQESGLRSDAFNPNDPEEGSYGVVQFNGSRLRDLREWSAENDRDWTQGETQWDRTILELETSERKAADAVRNATTVEDATLAFTRHFLRPHKTAYHLDKRNRFARGVASELGLSTDPSGPSTTTYSAKGQPREDDLFGFESILGGERESSAMIREGRAEKDQLNDGFFERDKSIGISVVDAMVSPGGGGTFGQTLAGIGSAIGGLPGMAIGSLVGAGIDSIRKRQDRAGEGWVDRIGDELDAVFGVTTAGSRTTAQSRRGKGGGSDADGVFDKFSGTSGGKKARDLMDAANRASSSKSKSKSKGKDDDDED